MKSSSIAMIKKVNKDSLANEIGLEVGDIVVSINSQPVKDIIDYLFLMADEEIELEIQKTNGEVIIFDIEKDEDEDLGVEFSSPLLDEAKRCSNACAFCFIDQMPEGMRETLYFKDDDSRLSFIQGNFVTLTNVSYDQLERIVKYRIGPINVSVHTTNPELRVRLLKNRHAGDIMEKLKILSKGEIGMNGQIVLMIGENDGEELDRTISDLASLYPHMNSVAVVPVGLTKFREGLPYLKAYDEASSTQVIKQIEKLQKEMQKRIGTRFVFAADEFYVKANREIPQESYYEGYVQIENGVGLIRKFMQEVKESIKPFGIKSRKEAAVITSVSAYNMMMEIARLLESNIENVKINVIPVENQFFGPQITVSGLICASDIAPIIEKIRENTVFIPESMLKSDEPIFLDDITISQLEEMTGKKIIPVKVSGKALIKAIKEMK